MEEDSLQPFHGADSILTDTVEKDVEKYMNKNDNAKPALDLLADNYEGFPDMIRALVSWSDIFDDGLKNLEQAVENVLLNHEQSIMPRLDEALTTAETSLPIISAVTSSERWHPVVSQMASRNKDSTLHNLLTRETRLKQAGITKDVLQTPEEFSMSICKLISDTLDGETEVSEDDMKLLYRRVATMATFDECTTVTALRLFNVLETSAIDPETAHLYRRISQEVKKEAIKVMSSTSIVPEHVARQYIVRYTVLIECVANDVNIRPHVLDALLNLLAGDRGVRKRYESEILTLRTVYGALIGDLGIGHAEDVIEAVEEVNCTIEEKKVLIRTLCHQEIFQDTLKSIFSHSHRTYIMDNKVDERRRKCLAMILAYAGTFIALDDQQLAEMLANEAEKELLRQRLTSLYHEIDSVAIVCEDLKPGCPRFKIKGKPVEILLQAIDNPLIARGIFIWAREGLQGGNDIRSLKVTAPRHLAFLEAIAVKHEVLRQDVLKVIQKAFMRDYVGLDVNQQEELRSTFIRSITGMTRIQMAPQIVDLFLNSWASNLKVDKSHLRHFASGLLDTISPPFSPEFAGNVLKLLSNNRVHSAIENDSTIMALVHGFKQETVRMGVV